MRRDRLSILMVLTALLAVGLVGAALVVPTGANDAATSGDRAVSADARGSADAQPGHGVALPAALGAVPLWLERRRLLP